MNDERIIKTLRSDPRKGMELVINEYTGLLYSVCRNILSDNTFCEADVEDCVSDTFCEAFEGIKSFDEKRGSLRSWLCVIARRRATDILRDYYKRINASPIDDNAVRIPDGFDLEEHLIEKSERARLISAIKQLDDKDREIIVRKFYLGQTSKQISGIMRISVSNVDTRTNRAIKKLRKIMGEEHL